jgi:lipoprotein-releasing system permease protein
LGQTAKDVQRVFLYEGLLITSVGAGIGMGLGVTLILVQQYIGFFPLQGGLVEFYPVELHLTDILAVSGVVFTIGLLASVIPVKILLNEQRLQRVTSS